MEIWDGYFRDGTLADVELVRGESILSGLYHLVCEVLVRHFDGDYLLMRRALSKPNYGGCYEATAGGSALKGEDKFACIKRELFEETGISSDEFEEIGHFVFDDDNCIFYTFLCVTDCDKDSIKLQEGETISYKWVNEREFVNFINSGEMIPRQKKRYFDFFVEKDYINSDI
ncbi:MAG: NUDIX domain-containing protein [Eubacterium sp.]|nr:NUDIX domain-containing protein [Eubacterium sp.]MDE6155567.1 NUDIX domain-containing protein [Eubacterium sp.]MDE6767974.1 NUDIX domain-containing protein [Eubacterium sp.]